MNCKQTRKSTHYYEILHKWMSERKFNKTELDKSVIWAKKRKENYA